MVAILGNVRYYELYMNRTPKTIAAVFAGCAAFALLIAVANSGLRPPAPLAAIEKRLAGDWNRIALQGEESSTGMTFAPDRTFYDHNGQFVGRWWISSGKLHVTYWSDDWRDDWSMWRPVRLWRALRTTTVNLDISFVGDGDRVELAQPGEPPDLLIRSHE
jgi:hypothetical protein